MYHYDKPLFSDMLFDFIPIRATYGDVSSSWLLPCEDPEMAISHDIPTVSPYGKLAYLMENHHAIHGKTMENS